MSFRGITATEWVAMENMRERNERLRMRSLRWLFKTLFPAWHASMHTPPWYIQPFTYRPFEDPTTMIRLIRLHPLKHDQWYDPHDPEQTVVIDTKMVYLTDCPDIEPFVAISYCWGDQKETAKIICDGYVMTITKSLHEALLHFRGPTERIFWADAICINQTDNEEKTHQVRLMRQIYEKAQSVAVWLGEQASYSDHVLNLSEAFGSALLQTPIAETRDFSSPEVQKALFQALPPLYEVGWSSVGQFLQRPWFGRMWVIQEIAVAPAAMLHCGSLSTSWSTFSDLLQFMLYVGLLERHPDNHAEKAAALMKTRENFQNRTPVDFLVLMLRHRPCQATIGKDKIFALSGLSDFPLRPDYTRTDEDVFTEAAIEMMKADGNLDILSVPHSRHAHLETRNNSLPSWVPDWTDTPFVASTIPRAHLTHSPSPNFHASTPLQIPSSPFSFQIPPSPTPFTPQISPSKTTLTLHGHPVDTITHAATPVESPAWSTSISAIIHSDTTFYHALTTWESIARARSPTLYITGEDMLDVYWQTLLAGQNPRELDAHRAVFQRWERSWSFWWYLFKSPLPAGLVVWWCWCFGMISVGAMFVKHAVFGWRDQSAVGGKARAEIQVVKNSILNRRLVRTRGGYVGLAASGAEVGDQVVLARGCRVPLVLRRRGEKDGDGEGWRFVGDAYVHGMMYGECFEEGRCVSIALT
ncbi:HET-domain-containing protein [Lepidopterella palustris CBS 459.81]|uniref:HET-domain-containing protein n=1 Tax=Lepidopterella palustris CBS 459.81 TaxID=1314670 RepID=A0A8E2E0G7_9PEZI|nr:HET-domain-containing protein [Lepidopterella palustris CBS 459.81]